MAAAFASVTTFAYRPAPPHIAQIPPPLAASATPTPMPLICSLPYRLTSRSVAFLRVHVCH